MDRPQRRRRGAAMIPATREEVLALCQQIDPNGCYTDQLGAAEGFEPIGHQDALHLLAAQHCEHFAGDDAAAKAIYNAAVLAAEAIR